MNNVVNLTKLTEEPMQTDAEAVVFICKSEIKAMELVVKTMQNMKSASVSFHFYYKKVMIKFVGFAYIPSVFNSSKNTSVC